MSDIHGSYITPLSYICTDKSIVCNCPWDHRPVNVLSSIHTLNPELWTLPYAHVYTWTAAVMQWTLVSKLWLLNVLWSTEIPLPNEQARLDILKIHAAPITKHGEIDYEGVVKLAEDFNGADLRNVCTEAGTSALPYVWSVWSNSNSTVCITHTQVCLPSVLNVSMLRVRISWKPFVKFLTLRSWRPSWTINKSRELSNQMYGTYYSVSHDIYYWEKELSPSWSSEVPLLVIAYLPW